MKLWNAKRTNRN